MRVVVYNPELVDEAPDTIDEVVAGDFADGRIGYAPTNASWQSFVTGLRVLRGEDGARQWLEAFAAQEPVAYEGNSQVRDAVDAGEVQIGLINHYYLFELIAEKGAANVTARNQFMAPGDPGGLVNVAGAGILASSDQQEQALALVDYLTGEKAQEFFAQQTSEYPLIEGVSAPEGLPSLESLDPPAIDLSDLDSIAADAGAAGRGRAADPVGACACSLQAGDGRMARCATAPTVNDPVPGPADLVGPGTGLSVRPVRRPVPPARERPSGAVVAGGCPRSWRRSWRSCRSGTWSPGPARVARLRRGPGDPGDGGA